MFMIYPLSAVNGAEAEVMNMVMGCEAFLDRHTGDVPTGGSDEEMSLKLINTAGIVSNDLHYLDVGGNGTPSGTGTTETQSIHIIGYIYMYKATGIQYFLDRAIYYWNAYFDVFYLGQPVPAAPQELRCHWMVNAKQPFNSAYPINYEQTSHSGWKGEIFTVVNNIITVPDDATYFGSQLQKVTFAFRETDILVWDAIDARVTQADWNDVGHVYTVEWFINYKGQQLKPNGDIYGENPMGYPQGTIMLSGDVRLGSDDGQIIETGRVFNEDVKLNFCTANGVEIGRNEPFDPRPLWTPLLPDWQGNASDAEQWFGDACYQLWEITGEEKYLTMHGCVVETCKGYADIDEGQFFWRRNTIPDNPYTDGISYIYSNEDDIPDTNALFFRNKTTGMSDLDFTQMPGAIKDVTCEQQAVWYKLDGDSRVLLELSSTEDIFPTHTFKVNYIKTDDDNQGTPLWFELPLPTAVSSTITSYDLPTSLAITLEEGTLLTDASNSSPFGAAVSVTDQYYTDIFGDYTGSVTQFKFTGAIGAGEAIGESGSWYDLATYSSGPTVYPVVQSVNFREWRPALNEISWTIEFEEIIEGGTNVQHIGYLSNVGQTWTEMTIEEIVGYPILNPCANFEVWPSVIDAGGTDAFLEIYCINQKPTRYNPDIHGEYLVMHRMNWISTTTPTISVGECHVAGYAEDNLAYTPGLIPFSNNFDPTTGNYDSWSGMPYSGYQYGWIWKDNPTRWHNLKMFLYDSQVAYPTRHTWPNGDPVVGPCSAGYVWNRWDNTGYGPIDTFVDEFFGSDKPWDGYQGRTVASIGRMYEFAASGENPEIAVDAELTALGNKWIDFLYQFQLDNDGNFPTYFPKDDPDDGITYPYFDGFTGHLTGNYLTGVCKMYMAGLTNPNLVPLIEALFRDIQRNYYIGDAGFRMNGCWSSYPEGGQYFGFWSGEIYRGLAHYIMFHKYRRSQGM